MYEFDWSSIPGALPFLWEGMKVSLEITLTAVVFGMPAELIRRGGASSVLPADRIAGQLIQWLCPLT